ncbi:MAG: hydrogenase nickel incorporation protein HypB [Methanomassiliicoccales archaeon]
MHKTVDISMETDVLEENRRLAGENRDLLRSKGIRSLDVLGSIGAGKTELILGLSRRMEERGIRCAAIAGDVSGQDDFERFREIGIPAVNMNTGKECHLDAHLVEHALEDLDLDRIDFVFIENVGNLVCPADFPLGTDARMVVVSVTEGDDMIRKHPFIFMSSDLAVLNKVDLLPHMQVDDERLRFDLASIKKGASLLSVSARTGEGVDELLSTLESL